MNDATIRYLNELNRAFYAAVADEFDATRQRPWPGWERLAELVKAGFKPAPAPLTVLDVGCGNGRFGLFLTERLGKAGLHYHGIDSSAALLERAQAALAGMDAHFEQRDIVEPPLDAGEYDLVALFGVLHHVPGAERRLALLRTLAQRVAPGGLLAFSEWRFYDDPHLRQRIVPFPSGVQAEPGDYLLDWRRGVTAVRYCHHVDDAEHARLVAETGLGVRAEYRADAANFYAILQREPSPETD